MRLRILFFLTLLISITVLSFTGCYYDKEQYLYPSAGNNNCSGISAKFSTDVLPIIQNKCATSGCHDATDAAGATILVTYNQVSAKASRIKQRCIIDKTMPPNGGLSTAEIAILNCWISSGAPNN